MHKIRYLFKYSVVTVVLIILTALSCDRSNNTTYTPNYGLSKSNILVDGASRRYAIYIPKNIGGHPVPLIIELHGGGVHIEDMTGESGYKTPYKLWMNLADKEKFIVVYPEGLNGSYRKPTWHDCRKNTTLYSKADDVLFISKLIDKISLLYNIDPKRIYVSGTSNGGLMALRLAVELPDKIAAVAVVAASMPDQSECQKPTKPISILFMDGTNDNHLPYNGGILSNPPNLKHGTIYPVNVSVHIWTTIDHTDKTPIIYHFPDLDTNDGTTVTKYSYLNGIKDTEVILYKINGGGHSAPSIKEQYSKLFEKYFGKQNHDIEMTTEVWKFFKNKYKR